jgi:hypothetical protein
VPSDIAAARRRGIEWDRQFCTRRRLGGGYFDSDGSEIALRQMPRLKHLQQLVLKWKRDVTGIFAFSIAPSTDSSRRRDALGFPAVIQKALSEQLGYASGALLREVTVVVEKLGGRWHAVG